MAMTSASARYDRMVREPASQGASEPGSQRSSEPASQGASEPGLCGSALASRAVGRHEYQGERHKGGAWQKVAKAGSSLLTERTRKI